MNTDEHGYTKTPSPPAGEGRDEGGFINQNLRKIKEKPEEGYRMNGIERIDFSLKP